MNMEPVEYLVHFSNVLLLIAYSVRDILWLRWFAVAAAIANLPYYLAQTTVLWPPVIWGVVFMLINLFQISRIYLERRPIVLWPTSSASTTSASRRCALASSFRCYWPANGATVHAATG